MTARGTNNKMTVKKNMKKISNKIDKQMSAARKKEEDDHVTVEISRKN